MSDLKRCLHCQNVIIGDYRKKFCNHSCAASFNNQISPKRKAVKTSICEVCGNAIALKQKKTGGFYSRKYCDDCLLLYKKTALLGVKSEEPLFENQTKGSLYARTKNWQSANSAIRRHSRKTYRSSGKQLCCGICQYSVHVEISHIKSVSNFKDDANLITINDISNLIALCPNHHWEFDNGVIMIVDIEFQDDLDSTGNPVIVKRVSLIRKNLSPTPVYTVAKGLAGTSHQYDDENYSSNDLRLSGYKSKNVTFILSDDTRQTYSFLNVNGELHFSSL